MATGVGSDPAYAGRQDVPLFGLSQRARPANPAAEQALLGSLLADNRSYTAVSGFLSAEFFADPIHCRIYQECARRIEAGQLADTVTLKAAFENAGILDEVGGTQYLAQLLTAMVSPRMAGDYGREIVDCWVRRRSIELGEELVNASFGTDPSLRGIDVIDRIEDELRMVRERAAASLGTAAKRGLVTIGDAAKAAIDRADRMQSGRIARPFSTGLPTLDRLIGGGVAPDTLTYLVGSGGSGKTELCLQVAESVAVSAYLAWVNSGKQGLCPGVLYISLGNMTAEQLGARSAARAAGLRLRLIRRGEFDLDQAPRIADAGEALLSVPMEIADNIPSTLGGVIGEMRRFARRRPLVLTIIDNFSDLLSMAPDKMFATAIGITKALKEQGATATNSAVWLIMHLNSSADSGVRGRSPRPKPSDIPWGTKKDADFSVGIWRPEKYLEPEPPAKPAKNLSAQGEEAYAKMKQEWQDKREPWPVGVRDITEVVPMKLREEEDDAASSVGRLRFDRDGHRFVDVDADAKASTDPFAALDRWGGV